MNILDFIERASGNPVIVDSIYKANTVLRSHFNIACSISGGKDSDIMLDLIHKLDEDGNVRYIWFDTGLEYQATKGHLDYLELMYDITIERIKAKKPIPTACKQYGQPFLTKNISEMIYRLQSHDFKWKDKPYEELIQEYPNCKVALMWWCNKHPNAKNNPVSMFNINYKKFLKEFLIDNPPWFKISNKCCSYAKKKVSESFIADNNIDLMITGIRRAEGGARACAYKNCFTENQSGCDFYRPLFWYLPDDEKDYDAMFNISHSECYEKWGMKRTGCVGCPFSQTLESELSLLLQHEPKLYKAATSVFADSYKYTRMYRDFVKQMKEKEG